MNKSEFLGMEIEEQIKFVNVRTRSGMKVSEVARKIGIGDKTLRTRIRKAGYTFDRANNVYVLDNHLGITKGITEGITSNNTRNNKGIMNKDIDIGIEKKKDRTQSAKKIKRNNSGISEGIKSNIPKKIYNFSDEEIKGIKELLRVKEELLLIAEIKENNKGITLDSKIDRSNRKKATFNMNIELLSELEVYEKKVNLSKSDIVNEALRNYLRAEGRIKE